VASKLGDSKLYGLVNNAGMLGEEGALAKVLNVNVRGNQRVVDAFAPLLQPGGRIVFISSAAGPTFVSKCSAAKRKEFVDPSVSWADIESTMAKHLELAKADAAPSEYATKGYGEPGGMMYDYGLSKACVNMLNHVVAREYSGLVVNACTPGFIETDLTKPMVDDGKTAAQMGMKSPAHGAASCMHLLFAELEGPSGRYYGSDAIRSPLDRYRGPGDPPFAGP
jgi:NAD(P)-dependent dehydrogenase (short-subunit alcohol dehydrogenase family)